MIEFDKFNFFYEEKEISLEEIIKNQQLFKELIREVPREFIS